MDADVDVSGWVIELLLRDRENERIAKRVLAVAPFSDQDYRLKKTVLLRTIECEVHDASVSETILETLETIEDLDASQGIAVMDSMKAAYLAVATECTVKFLAGLMGKPSGKYLEAVDRIWRGRVAVLERSETSRLVSAELRQRMEEVEAGVWDLRVSKKLSRMNTRNDALKSLAVYVKEALALMGPPFITWAVRLNVPKEVADLEGDRIAVANEANVGGASGVEVQMADGVNVGGVSELEVQMANGANVGGGSVLEVRMADGATMAGESELEVQMTDGANVGGGSELEVQMANGATVAGGFELQVQIENGTNVGEVYELEVQMEKGNNVGDGSELELQMENGTNAGDGSELEVQLEDGNHVGDGPELQRQMVNGTNSGDGFQLEVQTNASGEPETEVQTNAGGEPETEVQMLNRANLVDGSESEVQTGNGTDVRDGTQLQVQTRNGTNLGGEAELEAQPGNGTKMGDGGEPEAQMVNGGNVSYGSELGPQPMSGVRFQEVEEGNSPVTVSRGLGLNDFVEVDSGCTNREVHSLPDDQVRAEMNETAVALPSANGELGLSSDRTTKEKETQRTTVRRRKHLVPKHNRGPVKITDAEDLSTDSSNSKHVSVSTSKVTKLQEAFNSCILELQAVVTDPLPDALRVSEAVRSDLAMKSGNHVNGKDVGAENPLVENGAGRVQSDNDNFGNLSSGQQNDVSQSRGKEKDVPNLPVHQGKGTESAQADGPNLGNPSFSNQNNVSRPSLMERNNTACTFEWDDSIDMSQEGTKKDTDKLHLPSPKRNAVSPLKIYENNRPSKRRKVKRWSLLEEDTLRTGVQKYGAGNWKFILNCYRDIFEERTEVDLKDKWRNMTRR